MSETETKRCTLVSRTKEIKIVAEPNIRYVMGRDGNGDYGVLNESDGSFYWDALRVKMQKWADDFMDFIRDHRSQDLVGLEIAEEKMDVCSACLREWEPWEEHGVVSCAGCGAILEKSP